MKIEQPQIKQIKADFAVMQSREDLLALLNFVKPFIYGDKTVPFELKQLTWYISSNNNRIRYTDFKIKKKSGSLRTIHAPVRGLKALQKTLSIILQCVYEPHKAAMGFVSGRSIVDNAKLHVGNNYVYNIDLKDFFQSIDQARVWKTLQLKPFNLDIENRLKIANIIAALCCTEMEVERKDSTDKWQIIKRNVLPQGAPTSPVLTNIVCQKLDFLLSGVAKRFNLKYSRYADDITFSSMHNVYQQDGEFLKELNRIISEQRFHIKESKTRLQKDGYRKEVTGLLVNEKVNVQQRYIKQLRMWLYYWERYGYERASDFFLQQYIKDKGNIVKGNPDMLNIISGKLDYLKMVKGEDNLLYKKLNKRFNDILEDIRVKYKNKNKTERKFDFGKYQGESIFAALGGPAATQEVIELFDKLERNNEVEIKSVNNETLTQSCLPVSHKPKELERLLNKFSENNHPLKYASHSWGDGKIDEHFDSYGDFIKKFDELGRSVCFEIQKIKKSLGTKILHFLNTPNENGKYIKKSEPVDYYWGEYRMKYGWKSKELSIWASDNPSIDPFEFPLPNKTIITRWNQDLEISKFKDIVGLFKSEIEIRPDKSDLYNLFLELRRKHLGRDFRVDVGESLKGKQFYTDVHDFKRALNKIFHEISVRTIHPVVSISAKNYTEYGHTIIEVLHAESYCTEKTSKEMFKEINNGDFADILSYLENLCDWSVESEFSDGAYRINYLTSSETEGAVFPIEKAEGFKHVFKFYKS